MSKLLVDEISDADNTGPVTVTDGLTVQGAFTSLGIDDNATSTAMTIDSSGNVLVGTTSAYGTTGTTINAAGLVYSSADADRAGQFDRTSNDGEIVRFSKAGTTVGSISSNSSSYIAIGSDDTGILFYDGGDAVTPFNTTTQANAGGALDLGHSDIRWRNLYLSGGVNFGSAGGTGTATSNVLDDYEEGAWTPTLTATATNPSVTYTFQIGRYTKIGNLVQVSCILETSAKSGGSGDLKISGLPFTSTNVNGTQSSGSVVFYKVDSLAAENASYVEYNTDFVVFRGRTGHSDTDTWTNILINAWTAANPTLIQFSLSYSTAS
jgi:hypothetical protein